MGRGDALKVAGRQSSSRLVSKRLVEEDSVLAFGLRIGGICCLAMR